MSVGQDHFYVQDKQSVMLLYATIFNNESWVFKVVGKILFATFQSLIIFSGNFPEEDYQSIIETLQIKFANYTMKVQDSSLNINFAIYSIL